MRHFHCDLFPSHILGVMLPGEVWVHEIARGIARALFVSEWAEEVEKKVKMPDNERIYLLGAAAMDHWENVAPKMVNREVKEQYNARAWRLIGRIEGCNDTTMEAILRKAMKAERHYFAPPDGYAFEFGRCIGYHSVGRAVSWFDMHEKFGLVLPSFDAG